MPKQKGEATLAAPAPRRASGGAGTGGSAGRQLATARSPRLTAGERRKPRRQPSQNASAPPVGEQRQRQQRQAERHYRGGRSLPLGKPADHNDEAEHQPEPEDQQRALGVTHADRAADIGPHSMRASARERIAGAIVMPSAWAVFRL